MGQSVEGIRNVLDLCGGFTEVVLNAISLTFIILGAMMAFIRTFQQKVVMRDPAGSLIFFRMIFGGWLVVALEFQLAADVVGTIISPSYQHLIQLGAVAVIRTFLNYFLNRELNEEIRWTRENSGANKNV